MARIRLSETVLAPSGTYLTAVTGASVQVNVRGGASATVYAAATGGTTVANPQIITNGVIAGYVELGSYDLVIDGVTHEFEALVGGGTRLLGIAQLAAPQGSITTSVDVAGFSIVASVPVAGWIRLVTQGFITNTAASATMGLVFYEGVTALNGGVGGYNNNVAAASGTTVRAEHVLQATAGDHTYSVKAVAFTGTATIGTGSFFYVEALL